MALEQQSGLGGLVLCEAQRVGEWGDLFHSRSSGPSPAEPSGTAGAFAQGDGPEENRRECQDSRCSPSCLNLRSDVPSRLPYSAH